MADDLVVREWTEDEKYYVPVPYWEMYNVVARAHLAVVAERDAVTVLHQRDRNLYVRMYETAAKEREELKAQLAAMTKDRDYYMRCNRQNIDYAAARLAAMTAERDGGAKQIFHLEKAYDALQAHLTASEAAWKEDRARLTSLLADLQQEINDRAAREEKLRMALELIWRDAEKYSGWWAMNEARAALAPQTRRSRGDE